MPGPWEKYQQAAPSGPWEKYAQQQPQEAPQPGMLARGAAWVGQQMDRIPAGIRGYAEAIQTGDAYNAPNRAWQGMKDPASVQTSEQMMGRAGLSTEKNVPSYAATNPYGGMAMPYTKENPVMPGYTSRAEQAGQAFDFLAPTGLELLPALKYGAKGVKGAAKYGGKKLTQAAEKSILEKYSMAQARKLAPSMGSGKAIQVVDDAQNVIGDASKIMADKLREHDLLYNPGKANFNLQRDLKAYGKQIGETVQEMKARDVSVNLQKVLNDYAGERVKAVAASGKGVGTIDDFQTKVMPKLQAMIDNLGHDGAGNVPIDKAVTFRQELQDMVRNWGQESGGPTVQRVARELQYRANQAIAASDKSGLKLAALNDKFSDLKSMQPLIEDAYTRGFGRSAVGRDVRPLPFTREGIVNRLWETVGSPAKSTFNALPNQADKWANRGRTVSGLDIPTPASTVTPEDVAALKAPFLSNETQGLPPRTPGRRPLVEQAPTYIQRPPSVLDEGLPPRRVGNASPGRRQISPYVHDPKLDVSSLGDVRKADDAREAAAFRNRAASMPDDAFLKVLDDSRGWPPGLNEQKIQFLLKAYKRTKPDHVRAKILSQIRSEFSKTKQKATR